MKVARLSAWTEALAHVLTMMSADRATIGTVPLGSTFSMTWTGTTTEANLTFRDGPITSLVAMAYPPRYRPTPRNRHERRKAMRQ